MVALNYRSAYMQQGIALPMILILLLVMTLLGVASLNTTILEDQMSGNSRAREIAFNAAETTLRFAELHAESIKSDVRAGTLPVEGGADVVLFVGDSSNGGLWPDPAVTTHPGDSCTGGYCIPTQFDQSGSVVNFERWEDPALDVWNTNSRHHTYSDYTSSNMDNEGVFEAPKYIIEYMGDYPEIDSITGAPDYGTSCDPTSATPPPQARLADYPFCSTDEPSFFRITARALAGSPGRETVVILQSTIRVP